MIGETHSLSSTFSGRKCEGKRAEEDEEEKVGGREEEARGGRWNKGRQVGRGGRGSQGGKWLNFKSGSLPQRLFLSSFPSAGQQDHK